MGDVSLRDLLDADRNNLLDVVDWLNAMPAENFDKHVRLDVTSRLDPVAHDALRHPVNLERWDACLQAIAADIATQLADPKLKTPERDEWRARTQYFQGAIQRRRVESEALIRRLRSAKSADAARGADARRDAGERAVQRLKDAYPAQFSRFLAEEFAADGLELPDRLYRHLRNNAALEGADDV